MSEAELRKELDIMRNKLNAVIDSHNKIQRHLELSDAMWREMSSEPWVRFFMWIRPMNWPYFSRETIYPLRVNRERAPTLPPLVDVPPQMYDAEENALRRIPRKPKRAERKPLTELAASVRDET